MIDRSYMLGLRLSDEGPIGIIGNPLSNPSTDLPITAVSHRTGEIWMRRAEQWRLGSSTDGLSRRAHGLAFDESIDARRDDVFGRDAGEALGFSELASAEASGAGHRVGQNGCVRRVRPGEEPTRMSTATEDDARDRLRDREVRRAGVDAQ